MDTPTFILALIATLGLLAITTLGLRLAGGLLTLKTAQAKAAAAKSRYMSELARKKVALNRRKHDADDDDDDDDEEDEGGLDDAGVLGSLGPMVMGLATQLGIDPSKVMAGDPGELAKVQAALQQLKPANHVATAEGSYL